MNTTKKAVIAAAAMPFLSALPLAAGADCGDILKAGYYNVSAESSSSDATNLAYANFCEIDLTSKNNEQAAKASLEFLGISFSGGGSKTNIQTIQKQVCTNSQNSSTSNLRSSSFSKQIYGGAIDAWERCTELESRGLIVHINNSTDFAVTTVSLTWPATSGPKFVGLFNPTGTNDLRGVANCYVSTTTGPIKANEATTFPLTGSVSSFSCSRPLFDNGQGGKYSDATRLEFMTTEGPVVVDLPYIGKVPSESVTKLIDDMVIQVKSELSNSNSQIETGAINHSSNENDWHLMNGSGVRQNAYRVNFTKQFSYPPKVTLGLNILDGDSKFVGTTSDVTTTGFTVTFTTWGVNRISSLGYSWTAVGI